MHLARCGPSKTSRIVWLPVAAARQPRSSPETNADSTGQSGSSDVTSTTAALSISSQPAPRVRMLSGVESIRRFRIPSVYYRSGGAFCAPFSLRLQRFPSLWQIVGMALKKINFGRTTIARAKPPLRDTGPPRRKRPAHNQKDSPKQVELEPKLNAFLDTLNSQIRWLRRTTRRKSAVL